jgi:uncharacterized damage-inducible protein DinB
MATIIDSVRGEYLRYKALAEGAIAQLGDADLCTPAPGGGNSIATICWHVSGNLQSRFTDFLTSDGEKPWRVREEEFAARTVTRAELLAKWATGWDTLAGTLQGLTDADLSRTITIRRQPLLVHEALHRSLAHVSYHVGQIVYAARALRGTDWTWLSIPPGQSDAHNRAPKSERPEAQQAEIAERLAKK